MDSRKFMLLGMVGSHIFELRARYLVAVSVAMPGERRGGRCATETARAFLVSSFLQQISNRETENHAITPGTETAVY